MTRPGRAALWAAPVAEDVPHRGPLTPRFRHDAAGRMNGFPLDAGRVETLRFERRIESVTSETGTRS